MDLGRALGGRGMAVVEARRIRKTANQRGRPVPLLEWVLEAALLIVLSLRHHVIAAFVKKRQAVGITCWEVPLIFCFELGVHGQAF
jgi:hypothetical protein